MDLYFILVEPAVPGNIGAAARAIKTMGFTSLRMVNPCDHMGQEARMLAHASEEILENADIYTVFEEAISDLDLTIATTAKARNIRREYLNASNIPEIIRAKGRLVNKIGLVFGREESGLTNNEIRMCDIVSNIPMKGSYPSLNLSHSVMIYAYILASFERTRAEPAPKTLNQEGFRALMDKSKEVLKELDIEKSPALYNRILERLASLGEDDIHLLHSILNRYRK
jgi:tRNA/rRNA methyltransferase